MHRRARHLNPVAAGATIALDARFISDLANGAGVSSWVSRTGATRTYTQATSARRPIYVSASPQGGQPCVRFTAASQHWMSSAGIIFSSTTALYSVLTVGAGGFVLTSSSNTAMLGAYNNVGFVLINTIDSFIIVNTTPAQFNAAIGGNTGPLASGRSNTAQTFVQNRTTKTFVTTGTTANLSATRNATLPNTYSSGDINAYTVIPALITDSLRLRLLNAMSYSFKLPSS